MDEKPAIEAALDPNVPHLTIAPGWRVRLSQDIADLKKKSSTWYALGIGGLQVLGPQIRETWHSIPDDLKQVLPNSVQKGIAYAILILMFLALRSVTVERKPGADNATS